MATTTLLVEILVIGFLAQIWLTSVFLGLAGSVAFNPSTSQIEALKTLAPLLIVPLTCLAYAVGWAVNFASERIFKYLFEERLRNRLFPNKAAEYEVARILYLQHASSELGREFVLDRHILRIARANVVNFVLIAGSSIVYSNWLGSRATLVLVGFCLTVSCISFVQWRLRYHSYYKRISRAAKILANEPTDTA